MVIHFPLGTRWIDSKSNSAWVKEHHGFHLEYAKNTSDREYRRLIDVLNEFNLIA